mgnify:CR=1 FL=1
MASRNDKDFVNLMRVYLDAVFYPAVYTSQKFFIRKDGTMSLIARESQATKVLSLMR